MKKLTLIIAMLFIAAFANAQISGTLHNTVALPWNTTGEICIICHIPHTTYPIIPDAPLWNHQSSVAVYTPYTSGTMNAVTGAPDGSSKLCLSCHDGTVALENFSGTTTGINMIPGIYNLGTSLLNDHPISFTYNTALATLDGELANPSVALSGLGGTIAADLLISDKMQCSSCHDPHGSAFPHLLRKTNVNSAFCLTCHLK